MATEKTKNNQKKGGLFKAILWATFAAHQGFMSWLILTNFDNYVAVATAATSFGLTVMAIGIVGAQLSKTFNK